MPYTRVHRLLKIIALVQSSRYSNAADLAHECQTSERNIFRDLQQLQGAGVPIVYDETVGGYRLANQFFMPPVHLTAEEALALSALCEHIGKHDQIPFLKAAWRALHKIESQLPTDIQDEMAQQSRDVHIHTAPAMPPDGHQDVYEAVQSALASRRALRCKYEPATTAGPVDRDDETFEFHPYALLFSVRAWYAIGLHCGRGSGGEIRSLKLSRFSKVKPTHIKYEIPDDFNMQEHLGNAWRMIRDGDDVQVRIEFDEEFAQTVSDTQWHRTQDIVWHADGSCTFTCTVAGLSEIEWWVLSMGPHAKVHAPQELADRVKKLARETAAVYR